MLTLLTATFLPFFMLVWIMCAFQINLNLRIIHLASFLANVAVCVFPIEVLPIVYHYGYAAPFYNISKIARTIIFGTKNEGVPSSSR
jgi:hypothetical protein